MINNIVQSHDDSFYYSSNATYLYNLSLDE